MSTMFDVVTLLSSAAMMSRKAETYPPETFVIDLAELRRIIFELQESGEADSGVV